MVCMGENMVKCDICGAEVDDVDAKSMNIGKSRKMMCPECYKQGQKDVAWFQHDHWKRIRQKEHRRNE